MGRHFGATHLSEVPQDFGGAGSAPQATGARGLRKFAPFIFLLFLAILPYLNSLSNGFVYDDSAQVVQNPAVSSFNLRQIFGTSVWSFLAGYQGTSNYYRPMMTLGYAVCYRLFSFKPFGFHLANLLLNAAVVLLLFSLTKRLFGGEARYRTVRGEAIALAAAALFAIHPIHSEAVDWISAVTELELGLFALLTFRFYLAETRRSWRRLAVAESGMCAAFALALLSKEQAMALPLLATLYEHFYRSDRLTTSWRRKAIRYAPLWLLDGGYFLLRTHILKTFAPVVARPGLGIQEGLFAAMALFAQYMWKLIWPARLSVGYGFPDNVFLLYRWTLAGLALGALFAAALPLLWKRARPVSFGLLWIAITLAPALNARWMPPSAFGERYLYLPSMGLAWIAGWAAARLWEISANRRIMRAALAGAGGVILLLGGARIAYRNRDWRDDFTLYQRTLAVYPGAYVIRNNLGVLYWNRGDLKDASLEWEQVLRTHPDYPYSLESMGLVRRRQKRYSEAANYFKQCLQAAPDYTAAHLNLALTYRDMGMRDKEEPELQATLRLEPSNLDALNTLGELYFDERAFDKAKEQFRRSIAVQPTQRGVWGLGFTLWAQKDMGGAEKAFLRAESLEPSSFRAHLILGMFYASNRRTDDAIEEYQTALAIDPSDARAWAELEKLERSK